MSGKAKGNRRERQCAEIYRRAGYLTFRPQESQWGETDMFGIFDIVAVHRSKPTRWVQVKSNGARGILRWRKAARPFMSVVNSADFAVAYDRQGWRLISTVGGGEDHFTVYDGRETDVKMGEGLVEYLGGDTDE